MARHLGRRAFGGLREFGLQVDPLAVAAVSAAGVS